MDRPTLGTASVIRANSRHLPLADNSVDLVVTSPPYFALRSYQDGGEHYEGQIGDEPTPAEFVASLIEVTRECVRVLKPSGSLWVNLGDKYAQSASQWQGSRRGHCGDLAGTKADDASRFGQGAWNDAPDMAARPKSLIGIPWRYALRCIDDLGLILRAEVIWSKPNGLPESVTDRVRRSHEQWFHFTLRPRYFSIVDEIREPHGERFSGGPSRVRPWQTDGEARYGSKSEDRYHSLGKLPGSVWTVPTEPLRVPDHLGIDHFAAFPTEWPKRIIAGWSPSGVCVECGEGRRPLVVTDLGRKERETPAYGAGNHGTGASTLGSRGPSASITGYACACTCPDCGGSGYATTLDGRTLGVCDTCDGHGNDTSAPTTPAVVLDPFGGTGTTAMVAKALGRHGISVDMSADYCRLAEWRTNDRDQLAKVLGVAKAEQQPEEQMSMFDLLDGGAA